eukprot:TRINITY_DN6118_c0_g1_i9.p1 TRINITY_DN6118_c0_g1~~TRINITY_DN6118_c0_g1_i9.p1  ORF type:complete len:1640 (-),score=222.51 TRINITY_DN6118_c0_g1_i9:99-4544(-)
MFACILIVLSNVWLGFASQLPSIRTYFFVDFFILAAFVLELLARWWYSHSSGFAWRDFLTILDFIAICIQLGSVAIPGVDIAFGPILRIPRLLYWIGNGGVLLERLHASRWNLVFRVSLGMVGWWLISALFVVYIAALLFLFTVCPSSPKEDTFCADNTLNGLMFMFLNIIWQGHQQKTGSFTPVAFLIMFLLLLGFFCSSTLLQAQILVSVFAVMGDEKQAEESLELLNAHDALLQARKLLIKNCKGGCHVAGVQNNGSVLVTLEQVEAWLHSVGDIEDTNVDDFACQIRTLFQKAGVHLSHVRAIFAWSEFAERTCPTVSIDDLIIGLVVQTNAVQAIDTIQFMLSLQDMQNSITAVNKKLKDARAALLTSLQEVRLSLQESGLSSGASEFATPQKAIAVKHDDPTIASTEEEESTHKESAQHVLKKLEEEAASIRQNKRIVQRDFDMICLRVLVAEALWHTLETFLRDSDSDFEQGLPTSGQSRVLFSIRLVFKLFYICELFLRIVLFYQLEVMQDLRMIWIFPRLLLRMEIGDVLDVLFSSRALLRDPLFSILPLVLIINVVEFYFLHRLHIGTILGVFRLWFFYKDSFIVLRLISKQISVLLWSSLLTCLITILGRFVLTFAPIKCEGIEITMVFFNLMSRNKLEQTLTCAGATMSSGFTGLFPLPLFILYFVIVSLGVVATMSGTMVSSGVTMVDRFEQDDNHKIPIILRRFQDVIDNIFSDAQHTRDIRHNQGVERIRQLLEAAWEDDPEDFPTVPIQENAAGLRCFVRKVIWASSEEVAIEVELNEVIDEWPLTSTLSWTGGFAYPSTVVKVMTMLVVEKKEQREIIGGTVSEEPPNLNNTIRRADSADSVLSMTDVTEEQQTHSVGILVFSHIPPCYSLEFRFRKDFHRTMVFPSSVRNSVSRKLPVYLNPEINRHYLSRDNLVTVLNDLKFISSLEAVGIYPADVLAIYERLDAATAGQVLHSQLIEAVRRQAYHEAKSSSNPTAMQSFLCVLGLRSSIRSVIDHSKNVSVKMTNCKNTFAEIVSVLRGATVLDPKDAPAKVSVGGKVSDMDSGMLSEASAGKLPSIAEETCSPSKEAAEAKAPLSARTETTTVSTNTSGSGDSNLAIVPLSGRSTSSTPANSDADRFMGHRPERPHGTIDSSLVTLEICGSPSISERDDQMHCFEEGTPVKPSIGFTEENSSDTQESPPLTPGVTEDRVPSAEGRVSMLKLPVIKSSFSDDEAQAASDPKDRVPSAEGRVPMLKLPVTRSSFSDDEAKAESDPKGRVPSAEGRVPMLKLPVTKSSLSDDEAKAASDPKDRVPSAEGRVPMLKLPLTKSSLSDDEAKAASDPKDRVPSDEGSVPMLKLPLTKSSLSDDEAKAASDPKDRVPSDEGSVPALKKRITKNQNAQSDDEAQAASDQKAPARPRSETEATEVKFAANRRAKFINDIASLKKQAHFLLRKKTYLMNRINTMVQQLDDLSDSDFSEPC